MLFAGGECIIAVLAQVHSLVRSNEFWMQVIARPSARQEGALYRLPQVVLACKVLDFRRRVRKEVEITDWPEHICQCGVVSEVKAALPA